MMIFLWLFFTICSGSTVTVSRSNGYVYKQPETNFISESSSTEGYKSPQVLFTSNNLIRPTAASVKPPVFITERILTDRASSPVTEATQGPATFITPRIKFDNPAPIRPTAVPSQSVAFAAQNRSFVVSKAQTPVVYINERIKTSSVLEKTPVAVRSENLTTIYSSERNPQPQPQQPNFFQPSFFTNPAAPAGFSSRFNVPVPQFDSSQSVNQLPSQKQLLYYPPPFLIPVQGGYPSAGGYSIPPQYFWPQQPFVPNGGSPFFGNPNVGNGYSFNFDGSQMKMQKMEVRKQSIEELCAAYSPEEKTFIYVLSMTPAGEELKVFNPPPTTEPSRPEVFYIKYKTPEEAVLAQQQIQEQYDKLNGESIKFKDIVSPVIKTGPNGLDTVASAIPNTLQKEPLRN